MWMKCFWLRCEWFYFCLVFFFHFEWLDTDDDINELERNLRDEINRQLFIRKFGSTYVTRRMLWWASGSALISFYSYFFFFKWSIYMFRIRFRCVCRLKEIKWENFQKFWQNIFFVFCVRVCVFFIVEN